MKKIITLFTVFALIFSLAGCGDDTTSNTGASNNSGSDGNRTTTAQNNETVVVPNVVDMNKDEAVKVLEDAGLKAELKIKYATWIGPEIGAYEEDLKVLEQDVKSGNIMGKNSTVTITYNLNASSFKYDINDDNTITLVYILTTYYNNNKVIIPNTFEGKKVSKIKYSIIDDLNHRFKYVLKIEDFKIEIPYNVEIIDNLESAKPNNIIYY